jgi:cytolysin (calcineurin-like family phosphatase)
MKTANKASNYEKGVLSATANRIKGIVSWDWGGLLMVLLDRYEVPW